MYRKQFWIAAVLLVLAALSVQTSHSASLDAKTIKAGLRTTAIEEQGFVDYVLAKVDEGVLPASLVDSTFDWARKKPTHKFQYFKRGLIVRAAKIGIKL